MQNLFVSYNAKSADGGRSDGWATITGCGEPQTTADVHSLCAKIAETEGLSHVIPVWWRVLGDNGQEVRSSKEVSGK